MAPLKELLRSNEVNVVPPELNSTLLKVRKLCEDKAGNLATGLRIASNASICAALIANNGVTLESYATHCVKRSLLLITEEWQPPEHVNTFPLQENTEIDALVVQPPFRSEITTSSDRIAYRCWEQYRNCAGAYLRICRAERTLRIAVDSIRAVRLGNVTIAFPVVSESTLHQIMQCAKCVECATINMTMTQSRCCNTFS